MYVLTIDQRASTGDRDKVPDLLADLATRPAGIVLPFERTVGDEVQGTLNDAAAVVAHVRAVLRTGEWSIGLGIGDVDRPLPRSSREASGRAYVRARRAVERAKLRGSVVPFAVEGPDAERAGEIEALARLLGAVAARRTARGWEVIDALNAPGVSGSRKDVAGRLRISEQAVSQRLRAALWTEEQALEPLLVRLLEEADE